MNIHLGVILACDEMEGPFITSNRQLYRAGELLKLLKRDRGWDESLTVRDNFRNNRHWYYFYALDLPFHRISWNDYDREVFMAENPEAARRRGELVVRDRKKKCNGFMNRKEIRMQKVINSLETQVENQKKEIDRKEEVLQFTLTAHNNLKYSYAQLQQQIYALQQQNNIMRYQQMQQFQWIPNNINNNYHMYQQ